MSPEQKIKSTLKEMRHEKRLSREPMRLAAIRDEILAGIDLALAHYRSPGIEAKFGDRVRWQSNLNVMQNSRDFLAARPLAEFAHQAGWNSDGDTLHNALMIVQLATNQSRAETKEVR